MKQNSRDARRCVIVCCLGSRWGKKEAVGEGWREERGGDRVVGRNQLPLTSSPS